jgi:hypothetical protein
VVSWLSTATCSVDVTFLYFIVLMYGIYCITGEGVRTLQIDRESFTVFVN